MRSCHTLLNDGGFFVTSENIRPFSDEGVTRSLASWGVFQREAGRTDGEVRDHLGGLDREYFPITVAEHIQCYRDAVSPLRRYSGFPVCRVYSGAGSEEVFFHPPSCATSLLLGGRGTITIPDRPRL